ncbi:hypothetical protein CJ030_MR3G007492 [Morella rubra]|uniref:Uncharacterized protein n=1 Tax=Morella rubra TaxID=262757 RepID=A0A6A1WBE7_9ROSI|nr:hypothetical protein CJ030_MR3G007492 [Morella rubra]
MSHQRRQRNGNNPKEQDFSSIRKVIRGAIRMPREIRPVAEKSQQEAVQITLEEPKSDLENGTNSSRDRELREHRTLCAPLLQAALKGDWKTGEAFLKKNPHCIALPITKEEGTALHNAAATKRTTFVKQLVKLMKPSDLELQTTEGCTALIFAVQSGSVTIAREMVEKNNKLPCIRKDDKMTPLGSAAWCGPRHKKMVSYLLSVTPYEHLTAHERTGLLLGTIHSDMFGMVLVSLNVVD